MAEECCRKNQHYQDAEMEIHSGTFSLRKSQFVWDILEMYIFFFLFKDMPFDVVSILSLYRVHRSLEGF